MKIVDLNSDILSYILLFLDLKSLHKTRILNKKFKYHCKKVFLRYSFVCGFISNHKKNMKASILINPNLRNLKTLYNYKCKKKYIFFKNFDLNLQNSSISTDFDNNQVCIYSQNKLLKINLNK